MVNGCYRAVVTKRLGDKFYVSYMNTDNNYFEEEEEVDFEDVKKWYELSSSC